MAAGPAAEVKIVNYPYHSGWKNRELPTTYENLKELSASGGLEHGPFDVVLISGFEKRLRLSMKDKERPVCRCILSKVLPIVAGAVQS